MGQCLPLKDRENKEEEEEEEEDAEGEEDLEEHKKDNVTQSAEVISQFILMWLSK